MNSSAGELSPDDLFFDIKLSESGSKKKPKTASDPSKQNLFTLWEYPAAQQTFTNTELETVTPSLTKEAQHLNWFGLIVDKDTAQKEGLALAICADTSTDKYLLINPNLARGAFGQVSVWLNLTDQKLYVRKVQRERYANEEPKDGTHHFQHPSVPELVSTMNHGPQPSDANSYGNNAFTPKIWTTMTEYIDGFSLDSTLEFHEGRGIWIPESEIWTCAAHLLEVVIEMRFPSPNSANGDRPMIHHDMYPRNIVVEPTKSNMHPAKYRLIDFGMATREGETGHMTNRDDAFAVSQIMFAMMSRTRNRAMWERSQVRKRIIEDGAPYSSHLYACALRLQDEAIDAAHNNGPSLNEYQLRFWLEICRVQSDKTSVEFSELCTKTVPADKRPLLVWDGTQSAQAMEATMSSLNEEIWGPYRYAWIKKETLELRVLEALVVWGKKIPVVRGGYLLSEGVQNW